ncbi:MAG: SO2930 family diheme c-type cytochrome [Erythrobacter sp.]|uniref:SO2930 family diheme c-type cytochrome n=1 Tax=Erythrobacter sp. TaxID=1042 RepID=UPI00260F4806|nr:SO2930 family diheme c-type cytochrome [Erythrobacter sp.]MDJ0976982.1 SO2930 family diheme c-type cytochrome [Erythrobacter sp.]
MTPGFRWLAGAAALLSASIAASALPPSGVNHAVILGEEGSPRFPRQLSDYGFFRDARGREPAANLIPYELNTALFSDGADKLRYIVLPDGASMRGGSEGGLLDLPVGSAIIKTFAFGEGEDQRYIETRVLLHRADGWLALPYMWNEEQTEARLALVGARMELTRPDGRTISYQIPNKNQCKNCHQLNDAVTPIGPKARNLSRDWLDAQAASGRLEAVPAVHDTVPHWEARADSADLDALARGYLDVNCAHCHQPGGSASNSGLDLRWEQGDPHAIGIGKPPVAAGRGAGGHKVSIAPGDPDASILVYRMSSAEPGVAMPELGRSTNDDEGVAVIRDWVENMEPAS